MILDFLNAMADLLGPVFFRMEAVFGRELFHDMFVSFHFGYLNLYFLFFLNTVRSFMGVTLIFIEAVQEKFQNEIPDSK